jgi:hypothetical protein
MLLLERIRSCSKEYNGIKLLIICYDNEKDKGKIIPKTEKYLKENVITTENISSFDYIGGYDIRINGITEKIDGCTLSKDVMERVALVDYFYDLIIFEKCPIVDDVSLYLLNEYTMNILKRKMKEKSKIIFLTGTPGHPFILAGMEKRYGFTNYEIQGHNIVFYNIDKKEDIEEESFDEAITNLQKKFGSSVYPNDGGYYFFKNVNRFPNTDSSDSFDRTFPSYVQDLDDLKQIEHLKKMATGNYKIHLMPEKISEFIPKIDSFFNRNRECLNYVTVMKFRVKKLLFSVADISSEMKEFNLVKEGDIEDDVFSPKGEIFPKIVMYFKSRNDAQVVLDLLYKEFKDEVGASDSKRYFYQPRYNAKVTNLIWISQGNGDDKNSRENYYQQPDMIYFSEEVAQKIGMKITDFFLCHPETKSVLNDTGGDPLKEIKRDANILVVVNNGVLLKHLDKKVVEYLKSKSIDNVDDFDYIGTKYSKFNSKESYDFSQNGRYKYSSIYDLDYLYDYVIFDNLSKEYSLKAIRTFPFDKLSENVRISIFSRKKQESDSIRDDLSKKGYKESIINDEVSEFRI